MADGARVNSGSADGFSGSATRRERHVFHALGELRIRKHRRRLGGRWNARHGALRHQRVANGVAHEVVRQRSMAEADFGLRRMHVDVDLFQIAIQKQQREGIAGRRHQVVIGGGEGVQQQAVADQAPVDEQVNRIAIEALHLRAADEAAQAEAARASLLVFDRQREGARLIAQIEQLFEDLAAEDLIDALAQSGDRGYIQELGVVMAQQKALVGMRQAVVRDQRGDVRDFGLLGAQEFLARRNVVEQVAHGDDGAAGERGVFAAQDLAAREFDCGADGFFARARFEQQPRYRRDGRQRFAAESQRGDGEQIFHVGKFAGGVALEGQQRVVAHHAHAVVGQANQAAAAGFDIQTKFGGPGVERVFEQFFDDAGGALDHFSGSDFIGDVVGENADAAHSEGSLPLGRQ